MTRLGSMFIAGVLVALFLPVRGALGVEIVTKPKRTFGLGDLSSCAMSPDGTLMASAGEAGAYVWDFESGTVRERLLDHGTRVTSLAFSPDSELLVTGNRVGTLRVWNASTGGLLREVQPHSMEISSLSFSPDGKTILSASYDNSAAVSLLATGKLQHKFSVPGAFIAHALFTPDGSGIVTADGMPTNNVRLWDLESGNTVRHFGQHVGSVFGMAWLSNGFLATGGDDRKIRIWDTRSGQLVNTLLDAPALIHEIFPLADGTNVVATCGQGRILLADISSGIVKEFSPGPSSSRSALVPGTNLLLMAPADNLLRVVDALTGEVSRVIEGHTTSTTLAVGFSPDGQHVLSGGVEAPVRLWNRTNSHQVRTFNGSAAGTPVAAFSPDGSRVLTTTGVPVKATQLWNVETGQLERELTGHSSWVMCAAFSPSGQWIASGALDATARLYNATNGAFVRSFEGSPGGVFSVAFSASGTRLATGGAAFAPEVRVWNVATGQKLVTFSGIEGSVKSLVFSPTDEDVLVAAYEDGVIRQFNISNEEVTREIFSTGFLNEIVFSPRGHLLLSAEGWPSFAAKLYDWRSGNLLRVFAGHVAQVESVAFNRDTTQVLTGADVVRLWDISDLSADLRLEPTAEGLKVLWRRGTLQLATSPSGPWSDLPEATSPWPASPAVHKAFYRVVMPVVE